MRIWKQSVDLATVNGWNARTLMHVLDIRVTEIGDDFLRGTMPVDDRTRQPYGILHGGASVALAETLGSTAAMLCCEDGFATVGLDINANHLRAVREGTVTGTARPVHVGRSTQVWEIRIENDADELTCIARLTMAVVPQRVVAPRGQEGRKARLATFGGAAGRRAGRPDPQRLVAPRVGGSEGPTCNAWWRRG